MLTVQYHKWIEVWDVPRAGEQLQYIFAFISLPPRFC